MRIQSRVQLAVILLCLVDGVASAQVKPSPPGITTSQLLSLRQIGGDLGAIAVSPDGRKVAFQVQQADFAARTFSLHWFAVATGKAGKPVHLGSGGDLMLDPDDTWGRIGGTRAAIRAAWSPDGQWIAYLRKSDQQVQVWRSHVDGSRQEQVTHSEADVLDFLWKPDGTAIYFRVGRPRAEMEASMLAEGDRGFRLDDRFAPEYSLKPLWFACEKRSWDIPEPEGQQCTVTNWVAEFGLNERRAEENERTADPGSNAAVPPGANAGRRISSVTRAAPSGKRKQRVAWLENEDPETHPGYGAPLRVFASGSRCDAAECLGRFSGMWWFGEEIVFLRNEGHAYGTPALYAWRPGAQGIRRLYGSDSVLTACEIAGSRLVCLHETPRSPRRIISINLVQGGLSTVFDPNPQFDSSVLGRVEKLEWRDAYGNETFGHLVYPPDFREHERYPLVVVQYRSRGFLSGGVGNEYPIYPLAARGFLVLSFDRPEDRRLEARFQVDTLAEMGALTAAQWKEGYIHRQALTALERVVDVLVRRGLVDPEKVGITGLSNGAETVDYALTHSRRFAAAAVSGNVSPVFYYLQTNESLRALVRTMFGSKAATESIDAWEDMSLMHRADRVEAPLLIQVSDREMMFTVPAIVALRDAGKPVDAYVFPDEYHVKWQPQHKLAVGERAIDWFRFWLKNEEDGDGEEKVLQYRQWRELRDRRSQTLSRHAR